MMDQLLGFGLGRAASSMARRRVGRVCTSLTSAAAAAVEPLEGRTLLSGVGHDDHGGGGGHGHHDDALNVVYLATNNPNPGQNAILAYHRDPDTGALTPFEHGPYLTGGTGFYNDDERLGPDDSDQEILVTPDRKYLYVANQGSNDISVFKIKHDGSLKLEPGGPADSGGVQPASLGLARNDTLVVVNKGDQAPGQTTGALPNYTSFHVRGNGKLDRVSTVNAPPGSSPSQALITPDGKHVFGTNLFAHPFPPPPDFPPSVPPFASELVSLNVGKHGELTPAPGTPQGFPEAGAPPFILGLNTHPTRNILYTGFVVANQVGVYTYNDAGTPTFVGAVGTGDGVGICWIEVSKDGRFLYGSNAVTDSIAVFSLADPLHPVFLQDLPLAGPKEPVPPTPTGFFNTTPFQLDLSPDDDTLYVLNHEVVVDDSFPAGNQVHILRVKPDGTLAEELPTLVLPQSAVPAGAHPLGILAL
jgi:DNA-binding beta-propeller fold protein YncE